MRALDELIADSPVFAGLAPSHLQLVAGCARNEHVDAHTVLFRDGGSADRFFLIRSGAVALEIAAPGRDALVIGTLHEGDVVGWSWLFPPYRWHFDGRTTGPTGLIAFDGACLRGKCDADHELGYQLMQRFAASLIERLQATRLQLLDVYGHAIAG
ncbi:MAG TPA: cyclic nucleotide-binding domain-containing protein [Solirubrobacteraceae bacterium]|jgi:CRP/FNR family cyclic AMP-dependent transcriptional regulator|nr:cyclic nucleotide-binding domain-containing protein [Solirubrobacteraceae bacterium]